MRIKDHARGVYSHDTTADSKSKVPDTYESDIQESWDLGPLFLRARVSEENEVLRNCLMDFGHTWKSSSLMEAVGKDLDITTVYPESRHNGLESHDTKASQAVEDGANSRTMLEDRSADLIIYNGIEDELENVVHLLRNLRGLEVSGSQPQRIEFLFWTMSDKWKSIAEEHIANVFEHCRRYLSEAVPLAFKKTTNPTGSIDGFISSEPVASRFIQAYLWPILEKIKRAAIIELGRLDEIGGTVSTTMSCALWQNEGMFKKTGC